MDTDSIYSTSNGITRIETNGTGGGAFVGGPTYVAKQIVTAGVSTDVEVNIEVNAKETRVNCDESNDKTQNSNSYTVSEALKTPSSSTYTQRDGDTFIGRSKNTLFGAGKSVNLYEQNDGSFKLDVQPSVCVSEEFGTAFVYAQKYIEDVLIPNWEQMIDNLLTVVENPQDPSQAKVIEGKVMYYTKYPKGNAKHGLHNNDPAFSEEERKATNNLPSYVCKDGRPKVVREDKSISFTDSVEWCINQIKQWRYLLEKNEEDKLIAFGSNTSKYFENNYSLAGGTSINRSSIINNSNDRSFTSTSGYVINSETHGGLLINSAGGYAIILHNENHSNKTVSDTTVTRTQTVTWVLSDAEPTTALSVDVYKSPSGWGPVFRTRGGQTSNPYEPATYTQYYAPGNLLDEATMRVEKPELRVKGASEVTDILSGTSASFVLQLHNASETNTVCDYVLECKDGSNPNGAILMMDGAHLSNGKDGRKFKLKGGETIEKTLQVSQGDRSIVDYMNLKLVLKSATDTATVSAPVELSIHFIPASTPVELSVNSTSLIGRDYNAGGLQVTLRQLDRSDKDLTGVRVQYRRKGTMSWTLHKEWQVERPGKTLPSGVSPLPDTEQISTLVKFPEDGIYELRAQTFGLYGTKELTFETPSVDITQDIRGPKILGSSTPQGTATYLDRNNISVRFNEPIYDVALSQSDNFTITGDLCNTATSGVKTTNPDVTLQLAGNEISTQSAFQFNNSDIAIDLWLYRQSDGDIVSIGTDANQLSLSTNSGKAEFRLGNADEVIASAVELPSNKWLYIALSYRQDPANERGLLSALYADADTPDPVSILKDTPVPSLPIKGKLTVGGTGTVGRMRDLTLWNTSKDVHQLYRERELSKAPYTPGLVGYWRMNEGHGTTLNDKARSRNMEMKGESWYINNENRAVRLASEDSLAVDISTFSPRSTDSYALELWFRAVRQEGNSNASLIEVPNCLRVGFDDSRLTLKTYKRSNSEENAETVTLQSAEVLSERNYADNEWHHLALNVRRGVSAVAYIDGAAVKTLAESSIPAPASPELYVGKGLTGGIDDVRIWSASLDAKAIAERRYERLDSTYSGLIGYFPFEDIHRTPTGTVTSSFSMRNFGDTSASHLTASGISAEHHASATAPALLPVSQRMRLHETEYAFTASEREIYFSLPDAILPKMDGSDFTFRLSNIKDKYGNVSEPVEWTLHCDFSTLSLTLDETEIVKGRDEQRTFTATLKSLSGADEDYEFVNLPSWLEVSESIGKVGKSGKTITFTLPANIRIGHYTIDIFVQDRLNIKRSCRLHLVVKGFEPEWSVDERLYASNMVVTGQVNVGNKILEYEDSKIGAFDEQGNCIGVAHPEYIRTRDAYYVSMVVYGNPDDKPMTSEERHVYFRLYDSSTGTTYPRVSFLLPEENAARMQFDFTADATYGSYDGPVIFAPTDEIQQIKDLNKGWNWMSVYLTSKEGPQIPVNTVFKTVLPYVDEVKDHNFFAVPKKDRSAIDGSLKYVTAGKMYKVRMNNAGTLSLVGLLVDVENTSQTIQPEWNWMGSLTSYVMSPDVAFADLNPEKGDMVKNRTSFAEYNGYTWEGQLQEIKPGEGYLYHSRASQAKTFHYPKQVTTASAHARRAAVLMANDNEEWHWTVENINHYPDNMTILATLEKDGKLIDNAEVAAFINGECRGNIKGVDGHYFLTVLGISAEDTRKHVALKAWIGGTEYDIDDMGFNFISDASYGSFADGLVNLTIGGDTGINSVKDCDDNAEWYDLQGRKQNARPTRKGVFIRNNSKRVIK